MSFPQKYLLGNGCEAGFYDRKVPDKDTVFVLQWPWLAYGKYGPICQAGPASMDNLGL